MIRDEILILKSFPKVEMYIPDDNDAFMAGDIKTQYRKHNLSLVDCFIISIARRKRAVVFTTDNAINKVGKDLNVTVNYLPFISRR